MSNTQKTGTCTKCGQVFAPAGQGNCTLKCNPLWTDHARAMERLETSMKQGGATKTFIADREDLNILALASHIWSAPPPVPLSWLPMISGSCKV
ncbi:hypothetical protein GB937_003900 [Aspergillus fischeri]|nr:hypothetical protein GB937_003900 [Aspergillus fischeri]